MSTTWRVCVHGAAGRMGRSVIQALSERDDLTLAAATEPSGSSLIGSDAGELAGLGHLGVVVTDDLSAALDCSDVVIDFTRPAGTMALVEALQGRTVALITGTTGLEESEQAKLVAHARQACVVQAANFSVGVNVCVKLTEMAARIMADSSDIEIIEAHHKHKVDAPSGTALRLGQAVCDATGKSLQTDAVKSRDGNIGPRPEGSIGFSTVRGGDIVGEHTVMFAAEGERVEITHKASSRMNFASGAVRAAAWLQQQPSALYDMTDVLGL
ncbi:MAG: 4-hydroxy-tetrahydrodipicolinate reductase [Oceanococcus sp.]